MIDDMASGNNLNYVDLSGRFYETAGVNVGKTTSPLKTYANELLVKGIAKLLNFCFIIKQKGLNIVLY